MVSEITFPPGLSVQTTCEMCLRVRRGSPNPWDLCQLCVQHHRLPFVAVVAGFLFFTLLSFLRSNLKGQCNVSQILPGYEKYKTRGKKLNTDDIDALASVFPHLQLFVVKFYYNVHIPSLPLFHFYFYSVTSLAH